MMIPKCFIRVFPLVVSVSMLLFLSVPARAEVPDHEFIGAKKCSICHKKESSGNQYGKWQETRHSHAFDTLGTPEAKAVAKERGIDDPQASGQCLKCHSTAYYFTEERVSEDIAVEEGVPCESCHGPGKGYMKKSIMEDREEAIANGLVMPTETTCVRCHNNESPSYKDFDFKKFWEIIKHPIP